LDSIWRHLPEQDETRRAMTQALDKEHPLPNLDAAIEALVFDIVDLHQIATAERLKVATVKREMPKVGRNDPCPCGSGRKYKLCHGMT
ncbi:MAG TPA: SEC-C metal-binding domain-containing protein, partial [Methylibium sp.]